MWKDAQGNTWYKGNLHMHTRNSDGAMPFEEAISLYRGAGYDFLAATDHWNWTKTEEEADFVRLSGCEYDVGRNVREGIYHIVAIGCEREPDIVRKKNSGVIVEQEAQTIVDAIHAQNGIAILAHPSWSLDRADLAMKIRGFDAAEIYNTVSGTPWNARPYSGDFIDMMTALGYRLRCMAADDTHFYTGDQTRSYLMVKAEELSRDALMEALRRGDYIATQGPMMSVRREDNKIVVDCTKAHQVLFYSDSVYSGDRVSEGEDLTHAECRILPHESFIRVEVKDAEGRTAWSSPVMLR